MKKLLLIATAMLLSACAAKQEPVMVIDQKLSGNQVYNLALENTPYICGYKGNISVAVESAEMDESLKTLLDKQCNGDYKLVVLGVMNAPVAEIVSKSDQITVAANDEDVKAIVARLSERYDWAVRTFVRSPLYATRLSPTVDYRENGYTLSFIDGVKIEVDENFRFTKYIFDSNIYVIHNWDENNKLENMVLYDQGTTLDMQFLSEEGWRDK